MSEETKNISTATNSDAGSEPKTTELIDNANTAAERLEKATAEFKKENDRREALMAKERLGGRTAMQQPEQPKEVDAKEYALQALKGKIIK